jgi:membrane protein DedA with SNARE-associated domain
VVGVPWPRFLAADVAALSVHLLVWSGLGWWLAGDLARLQQTTEAGRGMAVVAVAIAVALAATWMGWRFRPRWQPATARAARRLRRSLHPAARP